MEIMIHLEIKQPLNNSWMNQRRNYKGKLKISWTEWKWKYNLLKLMGYNQRGA